jgi:hypothetical protein
MIKKVVTIIVFVLVVCAIAGCTTTSNTSQTQSAAIQHNAFLETYLGAYKNVSSSDSNLHITAWNLEWVNSTSARVQWTALAKTTNQTVNYDATFIVFPTTQDATNYLNAINKTAYSMASTKYPSEGAYANVMGHAPQIYKDYVYNEGNPSNISAYQRHEIQQAANIVMVGNSKIVS